MIKFFRNIRQNSIKENKMINYLKYAFGEIILVILGILIALNLNQKNDQKKAEAKVDTLFENVLKDLETDINNSTKYIKFFQTKDSLLSIILNTNLSYEDYANENSRIWRVALTKLPDFDFTDYAYRALMNNIDAIPEKYNQALSDLNILYGRKRQTVEKYNKKLDEHVEKSNDILVEKIWYREPDYKKSKEAIAYRLNDYMYKNRVEKYRKIAIYNLRTFILRYRIDAIQCYKEIALALNRPLDSLNFIIDEEVLKSYVGTYISNAKPESKAELSIIDGHLSIKRDTRMRKDDLYNISSENEFSSTKGRGGVFKFSKSNSGNNITLTIHEGHIPVTYTKIKP